MLISCGIFSGNTQNNSKSNEYNNECSNVSGKWYYIDDNKQKTNTYFDFDGSKDKMTFSYYENGSKKHEGTFRIVTNENNGKNTYSVSFILTKKGFDKEDWVITYADDFTSNFTQFTTIKEEQDLGMNDGRIYSHIYRISELPYMLGTYVLEGKEYKEEKNNYLYVNRYQIKEGTYALNEDVFIKFVMPKPYSYALFQYINKEEIIEGVYWTAEDKKTIYLYIDNDPYQYIRREDRKDYDMTFSHDYPPDFYLRGNFDVVNESIEINDLYHHDYSKTSIDDKIFEFGKYIKN